MQTTTNEPVSYVSNQLDELIKILMSKTDSKLAVTLANEAAAWARRGGWRFFSDLETTLKMLLNEVNVRYGADDSTVVTVRRLLASVLREMNRFADAESYDRIPGKSLLTVATLAADIFAGQDPMRYSEVVSLYRQALEFGFHDLSNTIWPSNVRAEIGGIYIALAEVLIAAGVPDKAEEELDALIALNDKAVAAINKNNGVPFALFNAYKLLVQMASTACADGNDAASARILNTALAVASRILKQDCGDLKVRKCLIELVWGTPK